MKGSLMVSPITFDTLAFANKLKAAGADPKLAEVHSEATAEILSDLVNTHFAKKTDIDSIRHELKDLKMELQATFFKMISSAVGILGALQIFFHFYK